MVNTFVANTDSLAAIVVPAVTVAVTIVVVCSIVLYLKRKKCRPNPTNQLTDNKSEELPAISK